MVCIRADLFTLVRSFDSDKVIYFLFFYDYTVKKILPTSSLKRFLIRRRSAYSLLMR